jgi:hypothetical protein
MRDFSTLSALASATKTGVAYPIDPSQPTQVGIGSGILSIAHTNARAEPSTAEEDFFHKEVEGAPTF